MNAVLVLILGFIVFFIGYRWYAGYIDAHVIKTDRKRATPAKMYMDGVEFMPTNKNVLFGYQFKSIAGAAPIIGPIIAIQWGWLPALIWILGGALFIGWVQDYSSAVIAMRNEGASFGGLSHKLISPRARIILLSFVYFYLLLIAGAFGNVVVSTVTGLKQAPMAWLFLTIGGVLAGQMIYRWKKDIILTTVVCVIIALIGIALGTVAPSDSIIGAGLANSRLLWALAAVVFCYFAAVLPIWRFALPINYVASYIVFLGLFFGIIGVFIIHPSFTLPAVTTFSIAIGPVWPIMFVTIACGAISGWHSIVSQLGDGPTARERAGCAARGRGRDVRGDDACPLCPGHSRHDLCLARGVRSGGEVGSGRYFCGGRLQVPRRFRPARGRRQNVRQRHDGGPCHYHHAARPPVHAHRHVRADGRREPRLQECPRGHRRCRLTDPRPHHDRVVAVSVGTLRRGQPAHGVARAHAHHSHGSCRRANRTHGHSIP